ncbi:hypothetical protein V1278_001866 [Bradyrhizobium sp. AZCC 1577]
MTSIAKWKRTKRRKDEVKRRAAEPSHLFKMCRVVGCKKPARAGTQDGLDTRFCRSHADHRARHGSPYKRSFTAAEINPYRRAAVEWLLAHENDRWVRNAIDRIEGLYRNGGQHEDAFRLRGLSPEERTRKAWARLRHHKVAPHLLVAAWLAVEMAIRNDPQADGTKEFKRVQAAKIAHRLASGTHKEWANGPAGRRELHVYPASRGQVLRHIGADLERAVELLCDHHLAKIQAETKGTRDAPRATPRSLSVRRRKIA